MYNWNSKIKTDLLNKIESYLIKIRSPKVYEKGEYVFKQGEKSKYFYFLKSGSTKTFTTSENGDEKTVFILRKKGIFATSTFFVGGYRNSSAIALSKSEIIAIDNSMVDILIRKEPLFALAIIQDMSRDINHMMEDIKNNTFLEAKQKLALFLKKNIEDKNYLVEDGIIKIKYSQEEIGKILGVSRVTINKILAEFRRNGWIDTKYRAISVLNDKAILKLSDIII